MDNQNLGKAQNEELGYDEIVLALNDFLDSEEKVRGALKDGVQVYDAIILVDVYPKLSSVYGKRKTIFKQIKNLDEVEARKVYAEVAAKRGTDVDAVEKVVLASLDILSEAYDFVRSTLKRGKALTVKIAAAYKEFF